MNPLHGQNPRDGVAAVMISSHFRIILDLFVYRDCGNMLQ